MICYVYKKFEYKFFGYKLFMLFRECLCFNLGKAARKLSRVTGEKVSKFGITTTQFFLLIALYEEEGITISNLAQKVALDKATLTGLLDRLERDSLIERRPDCRDRRVIRIHLKEKALRIKEEIQGLYNEINSRFLSIFSEEEKEIFESIISKIDNAEF